MSDDKTIGTWRVTVTGVGGALADFHERVYQVQAETRGLAVDIASSTYIAKYGALQCPFEVASVAVVESVPVVVLATASGPGG